MADRLFTDREKLEVVEHFIEQWRPARSSSICGERDTYLILKSIADDLRARDRKRATETVRLMQKAIDNAYARKTGLGFEIGSLRSIAEVVIGKWSTIRTSLEHFEKEMMDDR